MFTNGCFDLLHPGHIDCLTDAKALGDCLIVGLNSDASVRRLKGAQRPLNGEIFRAHMLEALKAVDMVILFGEDTPLALIQAVRPDILVKGGDYTPQDVVGHKFVTQNGGKVRIIPLTPGWSSTLLLAKYREAKL